MDAPVQDAPVPVVSVKGLVKRYGDLIALDQFDLRVSRGEILGLLGPNGSGKSTNINCILQLLSYDKGSVELFGEPMAPARYDLKRRIGVVPQQAAVFNELTVRENIDYFCSLYVGDRTRRRALVDEAIEFVGLKDYERFRPKKLSGGLLRRLNIACGIAHKPELIFFDEPTVAVDPQSRNAILDGIVRLRDEGATVVYTSHYMEEVEQICSRILIMDAGRTLAEGTLDELKRSISTGEKIAIELPALSRATRAASTVPAGSEAEAPEAADPRVAKLLAAMDALPHVVRAEFDPETATLRLACEASDHNLVDALAAVRAARLAPGRIACEPPTLNDVFLEITGRELRD